MCEYWHRQFGLNSTETSAKSYVTGKTHSKQRAANSLQTCASHFSSRDSTPIKLSLIFYGAAKTDTDLETYIRHKSSFPEDTFYILTTISELSAGTLTFSLDQIPMLNDVGAKALPMSKPVRARLPTQRPEKAKRAAQVLLDSFCDEGIATDALKCPDWLFRKIFPKEILQEKAIKSFRITFQWQFPSPAEQAKCAALVWNWAEREEQIRFLGLEKYI